MRVWAAVIAWRLRRCIMIGGAICSGICRHIGPAAGRWLRGWWLHCTQCTGLLCRLCLASGLASAFILLADTCFHICDQFGHIPLCKKPLLELSNATSF
jgi:hypothetical protein